MKSWLVREVRTSESDEIGTLRVRVYSQLDGFAKEDEMPKYDLPDFGFRLHL
jgi:hypothetical protein